ncbi:MAG: hypothetical protein ABIS01_08610 [Ferruginibacter sp.]
MMISFFNKIVDVLNDLKIPYMLSGSVAMGIHIVPRTTRDFDFVVYMQHNHIQMFVEQFKEGYYCDEDAVKDAIKHKSKFNIIDFGSHYKADFILMKEDKYGIEAFNRRNEIEYDGKTFFLVTAEDLLISKIMWIQNLQSAVQMEDIKKLCQLDTIDWSFTNNWIKKLKLNTFNLL